MTAPIGKDTGPPSGDPAALAALAAAAAMPFVQAAAGATARTVLERLRETVSLKDFGAVGDGSADDTAAIDAWLAHLDASGAAGYVPAGTYNILAVRHTRVANGIDVECHNSVRFVGLPTLEEFAGDGRNREFAVGRWQRTPRGFLVESIAADGTKAELEEGTGYTLDGQRIVLAAALPKGATLRVVGADPMMYFAADPAASTAFRWTGGLFDGSARGFLRSRASSAGSALTLVRFGRYVVADAHFHGGADYDAAEAAGVADTALTPAECDAGVISGCVFQGWVDRGIYITGGASEPSEADDGFGHVVSGCFFQGSGGVSAKRRSQNVAIVNCSFHRCASGASLYPASGNGGGRGVICNNTFKAMQGAAVDVRWTEGSVISGNRIVDFGCRQDGRTPVTNVPGIYLYGASSSVVTGNTIRIVEWQVGSQRGIRCATNTFGALGERAAEHNLITGNLIQNCAIGYSEAGDGQGNIWRENSLIDCATPVDVTRDRRWHYRQSNVEHEGIGERPFAGTFAPVATAGDAAASPRGGRQAGSYRRQGNLCTLRLAIDVELPAGRGDAPLLIGGLPYRAAEGELDQFGVVGPLAGAGLPAGAPVTAVARLAPGADRIELLLAAPPMAKGPLAIALSITYEVAGEAPN